jgi:hypothetical protein
MSIYYEYKSTDDKDNEQNDIICTYKLDRAWNGVVSLIIGQWSAFCETSGSIKGGKWFNQLSDY